MLLIRVIRESNACLHLNFPELIRQKDKISGHLLGEEISEHSRRWHHRFRRDGLDDFVRMLRLSVNVGSSKIVALSFTKHASKLSCCAE